MAERMSAAQRRNGNPGANGDGGGDREGGRPRGDGLAVWDAVQRVREDFSSLLGRPIAAVLGVQRDGDGWEVTVQVVELARVPSTTDVLGAYLVMLDGEGELAGYGRPRRYTRSQADED